MALSCSKRKTGENSKAVNAKASTVSSKGMRAICAATSSSARTTISPKPTGRIR